MTYCRFPTSFMPPTLSPSFGPSMLPTASWNVMVLAGINWIRCKTQNQMWNRTNWLYNSQMIWDCKQSCVLDLYKNTSSNQPIFYRFSSRQRSTKLLKGRTSQWKIDDVFCSQYYSIFFTNCTFLQFPNFDNSTRILWKMKLDIFQILWSCFLAIFALFMFAMAS